jgi:hypothetical protein
MDHKLTTKVGLEVALSRVKPLYGLEYGMMVQVAGVCLQLTPIPSSDRKVWEEATSMKAREAMEFLSRHVSMYFVDDSTDLGIEHMREHYLPSKSHPHWVSIRSAFDIVLEQCSEAELNEFVQHEFNRYVPCLPEGAKGFLTHIYKEVFETE